MKLMVCRTIRNGRVKIGGKYFYVEEKYRKYNGELDNKRFIFGRYPKHDGYENFISIWGGEEEAKNPDIAYEKPYAINGELPWEWWREKQNEEIF